MTVEQNSSAIVATALEEVVDDTHINEHEQ